MMKGKAESKKKSTAGFEPGTARRVRKTNWVVDANPNGHNIVSNSMQRNIFIL